MTIETEISSHVLWAYRHAPYFALMGHGKGRISEVLNFIKTAAAFGLRWNSEQCIPLKLQFKVGYNRFILVRHSSSFPNAFLLSFFLPFFFFSHSVLSYFIFHCLPFPPFISCFLALSSPSFSIPPLSLSIPFASPLPSLSLICPYLRCRLLTLSVPSLPCLIFSSPYHLPERMRWLCSCWWIAAARQCDH